MKNFLTQAGWGGIKPQPITPDWSPRHYYRLVRPTGETAIFLQGPVPDFRGHSIKDFVGIGSVLRTLGLSVPEIYAHDYAAARLLMEDFGSISIDAPDIEREAYEVAIDLLAVLRRDTTLAPTLVKYEDGYIYKKLPLYSDDPKWMQTWLDIESSLPPCPHGLCLMDYRAGNLFWLSEREGVKRIGLLDYQAAQNAPFLYDCVTLLEDARRNLAPDLKTHLKNRYRDALPENLKSIFDVWHPVIAAQFHLGVLGQIRGKDHVPEGLKERLEAYVQADLLAPQLKSLRTLF